MQFTSARTAGLAAACAVALALSACGDNGTDVGDEIQEGVDTVTEQFNGNDEAGDTGATPEDDAADAADDATTGDGETQTVTAADGTEVTLEGELAEKYSELEPELGPLSGQLEEVAGGQAAEFENGTIYFSEGTGAHLVQGEILRVYLEHEGPAGQLGFPTSDEEEIDGGWQSDFANGTITWTDQGDGTFAEEITMN